MNKRPYYMDAIDEICQQKREAMRNALEAGDKYQ